jgi:GTPase SAR1 family protein
VSPDNRDGMNPAEPGPLSGLVLAALADLGPPPEELRERWRTLSDGLRGPLRVAVVGRVKAGKSTLVNALLGQVVAATGPGECTRTVARFRYGFPERVVDHNDGGRDIFLSNELLRSLTIIDTPGLDSVHEAVSRATWDLLDESGATADLGLADALILVVNDRLASADLDALGRLSGRRNADFALAVSCLGVLTRIDLYADDADLDQHARAVTTAHRSRLREHVSDVVPVLGLLGEAGGAGRLTEADAAAIARLGELDDDVVARVLSDADEFRGDVEVGLAETVRERLIERLGMFGVRESVRAYRCGARGAGELTAVLTERSGITQMREWAVREFTEKGDALRVSRSLRQLFELSYHATDDIELKDFLDRVRESVETLRLSPGLHRLDELRARQAVCSEAVRLPEPWRRRFMDLTASDRTASDPEASDPGASDRAGGGSPEQWHRFALTAALSQQWIAQVALRSLALRADRDRPADPPTTPCLSGDDHETTTTESHRETDRPDAAGLVPGYRLRDLVHIRRRPGRPRKTQPARSGR